MEELLSSGSLLGCLATKGESSVTAVWTSGVCGVSSCVVTRRVGVAVLGGDCAADVASGDGVLTGAKVRCSLSVYARCLGCCGSVMCQ